MHVAKLTHSAVQRAHALHQTPPPVPSVFIDSKRISHRSRRQSSFLIYTSWPHYLSVRFYYNGGAWESVCCSRDVHKHLPSVCLSVWLTECLSVWLTDWLTVSLTDWLSVSLTAWMPVCLFVSLTDWMFVCLSLQAVGRGPSPATVQCIENRNGRQDSRKVYT